MSKYRSALEKLPFSQNLEEKAFSALCGKNSRPKGACHRKGCIRAGVGVALIVLLCFFTLVLLQPDEEEHLVSIVVYADEKGEGLELVSGAQISMPDCYVEYSEGENGWLGSTFIIQGQISFEVKNDKLSEVTYACDYGTLVGKGELKGTSGQEITYCSGDDFSTIWLPSGEQLKECIDESGEIDFESVPKTTVSIDVKFDDGTESTMAIVLSFDSEGYLTAQREK